VLGNSRIIFKTNYRFLRRREVAMIQSIQLRASSNQVSGEQSNSRAYADKKVTLSYDKSAAVVVLPAVGDGRLEDGRLRRWLARSSPVRMPDSTELLASILDVLKLPSPDSGLAAMRMWGQTGDRPSAWIAAAEPVYMEPRLDHLCLHAQSNDSVPISDLRPLFEHLQRSLAEDSEFGFARIGSYGYVSAVDPIATASLPAYAIDQQNPDDFMPSGESAASYRNLISEVEMALHDHEVNQVRQAIGLAPVNSLWLWGGGTAPEQITAPHPPLFGDDPLLKGYWYSKTGVVASWPGTIAQCLEASVGGFVAVVSKLSESADDECLHSCLTELRAALKSGRLSSLTLIFRDGIKVEVVKQHSLRFWRRNSPLLEPADQ
jgi:hypothetical protein